MESTLPTRRLVLGLYKSLQKIASKYDKNVPCGKNPLFLMQWDKDAKSSPELQSVRTLVREPFKANKDLRTTDKITPKIQDAFSNLKILHQFYKPSVAWIDILGGKNIPFEEVLLTICKFENPENPNAGVEQLNILKQKVQAYLTKALAKQASENEDASAAQPQETAQVNAEAEGEIHRAQAAIRKLIGSLAQEGKAERSEESSAHAKLVLDAISRVVYRDMGFRESASREGLQLSKSLSGGPVPQSVLASTIIALAQHEGVQLYSIIFSHRLKNLLRYSYLQEATVCHENDIFIDPSTGEVLQGLRAVKQMMDKKEHVRDLNSVVLVEHKQNSAFVLQMAVALAAHKPGLWKEHLTVIEELKKQPESGSEPTQLFQFSVKTPKAKEPSSETSLTDDATPPYTRPPSSHGPVPSSSSPSSSSSSSSTSVATASASTSASSSSTSASSSSTAASSSSTPASSSSTPASSSSTPASSSPASSSSTSASPSSSFFSNFLSFFSRPKTPSPAPSLAPSLAPEQTNQNEPEQQKESEKDEGEEKGGEKSKAPKIRSAHSAPPLPNHLRKYSRMWSQPSDLPTSPKNRRF